MANRRSKLLLLGLAGATAYGAWTLGSSVLGDDDSATEGTQYAVNHVWVERLPQDNRELVGHLTMVNHPQGHFGLAGRSSQFLHFLEVFIWKLDGHRLRLFFPQDEVHAKLHIKTYDCEGDAPAPFEICMDLEADGRQITYYSRRDWEIDPNDVEDSLDALAQTYPTLAHTISSELTAEHPTLDLDTAQWTETSALPWQ